jgi:hypothetical protein
LPQELSLVNEKLAHRFPGDLDPHSWLDIPVSIFKQQVNFTIFDQFKNFQRISAKGVVKIQFVRIYIQRTTRC